MWKKSHITNYTTEYNCFPNTNVLLVLQGNT